MREYTAVEVEPNGTKGSATRAVVVWWCVTAFIRHANWSPEWAKYRCGSHG